MTEEDSFSDGPLFNTEKLQRTLSFYKFPLILGVIGITLLVFAIALLIKNQTTGSGVEFITEATSSSKAKIQVDVQGAVMSPGVYEMEKGSRIVDVLASAGGLSLEADRDWMAKNLNRAAKLIDGSKIYIPSVNEVAFGKSPVSSEASADKQNLSDLSNQSNLLGVTSGLVNINSASKAELEALPGIGPVTAGKIISGRPYQTIEELRSRKITGQAVFNKIKDLITVY